MIFLDCLTFEGSKEVQDDVPRGAGHGVKLTPTHINQPITVSLEVSLEVEKKGSLRIYTAQM